MRTSIILTSLASCLLVGLLVQGCVTRKPASVRLKAHITNQVHDADRAEKLLDLAEQLDERFERTKGDIRDYDARIRTMVADYDATSEQIATALAEFDEVRAQRRTELLGIIRQMRATATADEWPDIAKLHIEMLSETVISARGPDNGA